MACLPYNKIITITQVFYWCRLLVSVILKLIQYLLINFYWIKGYCVLFCIFNGVLLLFVLYTPFFKLYVPHHHSSSLALKFHSFIPSLTPILFSLVEYFFCFGCDFTFLHVQLLCPNCTFYTRDKQ